MYNYLFEKVWGQRHKPRRHKLTNAPKPPAPHRPPISLRIRCDQHNSPLFDERFPTELRLFIYEAALGDSTRPMHIVPYEDESHRVGHWRCEDMNSPYPKWQHKCFGVWLSEGHPGRVHRITPYTNDKLLGLLLSCRLIYSEAITILYTANYFSLKGARGILALRSVVPAIHWQKLRHLQVSTVFLTPKNYWMNQESYPPENFARWSESCQALRELTGLHSLRFDIIIYNTHDRNNPAAVDTESLVSILNSIKDLKAVMFEVEINFTIPEDVQKMIGETNYVLVVKERPYNRALFTM